MDKNEKIQLEWFKLQYNIVSDEKQDEVIVNTEGPCNVVACPGSGKTSTVVNRLGYMIYCRNIPAENILALTYTNAAVAEMRERYKARFRCTPQDDIPEFSTINSFCANVMRRASYMYDFTCPVIPEEHAKVYAAAVREAYRRQKPDYLGDRQVEEIQNAICIIKNRMLRTKEDINAIPLSNDVGEINLFELYTAYNKLLYDHDNIDFDDQLRLAYKYMLKFPELLAMLQDRYRYVILDESQDTSRIQFAVLKLLVSGNASTKGYGNICITGDDDQSIYGFRGANPEGILNFHINYPGARRFYLETNYRSRHLLILNALKLINHNTIRFRKNMKGLREGHERYIRRFVINEAKFMYGEICKEIAEDYGKSKTIGVLYRNSESAIPLMNALRRKGMSANCRKEYFKFFQSPVVLDYIAILSVALDPHDFESFSKIYYKIGNLYLKKQSLEIIAGLAESKGVIEAVKTLTAQTGRSSRGENFAEFFASLKKMKPEEAVNAIFTKGGYGEYLKRNAGGKGIPRSAMRKIDTIRMIALGCESPEELLDGLSQRAEGAPGGSGGPGARDGDGWETGDTMLNGKRFSAVAADEQSCKTQHSVRCNVSFSTIHSAKGLEYDKVIFIDPYADIFMADENPDNQEESEESRRLFYVAVTRARDELHFYIARHSFGIRNKVSEYYYEYFGEKPPAYDAFSTIFISEAEAGVESAERKEAEVKLRNINGKYFSGSERNYSKSRSDRGSEIAGKIEEDLSKGEFKNRSSQGYSYLKPHIRANAAYSSKKRSDMTPESNDEILKLSKIYSIGRSVRHDKFGIGKVVKSDSDGELIIEFTDEKSGEIHRRKFRASNKLVKLLKPV